MMRAVRAGGKDTPARILAAVRQLVRQLGNCIDAQELQFIVLLAEQEQNLDEMMSHVWSDMARP